MRPTRIDDDRLLGNRITQDRTIAPQGRNRKGFANQGSHTFTSPNRTVSSCYNPGLLVRKPRQGRVDLTERSTGLSARLVDWNRDAF